MMEDNFLWFKENYDALFQKYGKSYLVIKDKKVIGCYASYGEAVRETEKTEEPETFNVQYCDGTASAYEVQIMSPIQSSFG